MKRLKEKQANRTRREQLKKTRKNRRGATVKGPAAGGTIVQNGRNQKTPKSENSNLKAGSSSRVKGSWLSRKIYHETVFTQSRKALPARSQRRTKKSGKKKNKKKRKNRKTGQGIHSHRARGEERLFSRNSAFVPKARFRGRQRRKWERCDHGKGNKGTRAR